MKKFLMVLFLCTSCATLPARPPAQAAAPALIGEHGFDVSGIDSSVAACDDFYHHSVGNWRKAHPLPAAFSRYGRFEELAERNRKALRTILEGATADSSAAPGSATQKIGSFYAACMNEPAIEAAGLAPISVELDRIVAIDSREAVQDEIFILQQVGIRPVFNFRADNDFKNSRMIIASLGQGGLGLPDRDYYLRDDERFSTIRKQYVDHIAKMFELSGISPVKAATDAERVLTLETELARASMSRVDMRKPELLYNITRVSEIGTLMPGVHWKPFFDQAGLTGLASLNVEQPEYFRRAARLLDESPIESWKAYLRWNVLDSTAATLPKAFAEESFNFRGKTLSGQKIQQERWQRCVRATDASVGQLLGQEYVKRAFTPEARRKMNELIDNLIAALREGIPQLPWMGETTRRAALEKLEAFSRRIGYPDKWIDYAALELRDSYAGNVAAARSFSFRRSMGRIGKADDPDEWGFFTPPTVNASYSPARNSITFPAGILQPPFYDPNADDAYNYGGIGSVIGHEMTHGFDDQGAKFDADGNLRDWWTPEDLKNFQGRAECIARQYDEFVVEPGLNTQGKLVTGEAIADLGGVTIALRAYQKSLEGKERKVVDGFSPEQRFFLGFAQVWGETMAPEEQRRRALTDPHAQGPFRVNATVSNMPEFQKAFLCPGASGMVRDAAKRCTIW